MDRYQIGLGLRDSDRIIATSTVRADSTFEALTIAHRQWTRPRIDWDVKYVRKGHASS